MTRILTWCAIVMLAQLPWAVVAAASQADTRPPEQVTLSKPLKDAALNAQRVTFAQPKSMTFDGKATEVRELLELRVSSSESIPVRAQDPVLYIGNTAVREYRYEDEQTLVFVIPDGKRLKTGQKVSLQFGNDKATRTQLPALDLQRIKTETR